MRLSPTTIVTPLKPIVMSVLKTQTSLSLPMTLATTYSVTKPTGANTTSGMLSLKTMSRTGIAKMTIAMTALKTDLVR